MSGAKKHPFERRRFLAQVGGGLTLIGGAVAAETVPAAAQAGSGTAFQPARHGEDDWLDKVAGKHRIVFDTTTPEGAEAAELYADNYFVANRTAYGLQDRDLAVVIVLRHFSTPFAYNDAIWAKFGVQISNEAKFVDPKTKQPATSNVHRASLDALAKRGVQFAVCQMATKYFANKIATATGGNENGIYDEIVANVLSNSHLVAAGIVAVNRAQERGYSFAHAV
jgi:intracellular sulfur oxidation DsrE/DsrF family protein